MDSRKKSTATIVILAFVYSIVVIMIPFTKNGIFFLSYFFTLAAIIGQAFIWNYAWTPQNSLQSKFYGLPVIMVGTVYLAVQFVTGIVFMCLAKWTPLWIPGVLYVIILGAMLIGCIAADITRNEAERIDQKQLSDTAFIKQMRTAVFSLCVPDSETTLSATITKLQDTLRYSDPVSTEALKQEEEKMEQTLHLLQMSLTGKDYEKAEQYAGQLITETEVRNNQCRRNKNNFGR